MTGTTLTPGLLRQRLRPILTKCPEASIVGIRSSEAWRGADHLEVGERAFRVAWCPSVLAVREQLANHKASDELLLILTNQGERDLGDDAVARLTLSKLFAIERWRLLGDLFEADRIDPRLTREDWLAEELIACAPGEGIRPVPAGFLDEDTAWTTYLGLRFGFPEGRTDLPAVLEWSIHTGNVSQLMAAPDEVQAGVSRRLASTSGLAGEALAGLLRDGRGSDALPLGLAVGVIFSNGEDGRTDRREASIRLEGLLGGLSISPEAGRRWADAAEGLVDRLASSTPGATAGVLGRADELLEELRIADYAHLSDVLPSSARLRMARYAAKIQAALASGAAPEDLTAAGEAAALLLGHRGLDARSRRAASYSIRLLRGLEIAQAPPMQSFEEAARAYADHGAFLDWARDELHASETDPVLGNSYSKLLKLAEERRHTLNERFGSYVAGWFAAGSTSPELIPLESILEEVVAPLAAEGQVLLLVIDGLSLSIFQRLLDEILNQGWTEIGPGDVPLRRLGLTLLPSLTNVCRSSLLSGERLPGAQAKEKKRFENHPLLRQVSKGGSPPVLFHKAGLRSDAAEALAPDLQAEIDNSQRRIVGVVVNAVDDYLQKSEQLRTDWGLEAIKPLAALLEAAATNERFVVLTADHGHIPERGLELTRKDGAGDRYRAGTGEAEEGEALVEGVRVLAPDNRIIVPWSERIRYRPRKTGYHGGASPQEMLVPLAVLASGSRPDGWREVPAHSPEWWSDPPLVGPGATAAPETRPPKKTTVVSVKAQDDPQPTLFPTAEPEAPTQAPGWVELLFASAVYAEQRELSGRTAPVDAKVLELLVALDARGGVATRMALCQTLDLPRQRLDGLVAAVERLLNVEGYATLEFHRDTGEVRLNHELLKEQFQLS